MATGSRRRPAASGPTVGPRLVPPGGIFGAADQARSHELRFVATELLATAAASAPAAGGIAEAIFQVQGDRVWQIERIAVSTNSGAVTAATVYIGAADPANVVDLTPVGNGDIADETQPIMVPGNSVVRVQWTGMTNGAVGVVRIQGWAGSLTMVAL